MIRNFFLSLTILLLFLTPRGALAESMEELFGATNINAAVGNGGLTAAFSARGELTVLRWPNPSFYDHLAYLTSNAPDARSLPYFGALPTMGAFFGLVIEHDGVRETTWLRDEPWTTAQYYADDRTNTLIVDYEHPELGLHARTIAFVLPADDLLVWRLEASAEAGAKAMIRNGIFYENLSPCLRKIPLMPVDSWALDMWNDFGALYDASIGAIVHFQPRHTLADVLSPLLTASSVSEAEAQAFLDQEVSTWPEGVYLGVAVQGNTGEYQVGEDDGRNCEALETIIENEPWGSYGLPDWLQNVPPCLADPMNLWPMVMGWKHRPESAMSDAADGALRGSPAAGMQTNGAFLFPVGEGATILIGAAESLTGLRDLLTEIAAKPYDRLKRKTDRFWRGWTTGAEAPATDDPDVLAFSIRSLISIKTAQDRLSGNIVASVSTQPPYSYDWPRDASFLNYALDLSGYREEVTLHNLSYADWQRKTALPFDLAPIGTYHMNYDAEGLPGGPILFEIDNSGLITWSLWDHYLWLAEDGDPGATDYLESVYPAIALAADGLAACKDESTGLQCFAIEDDTSEPRQTMQGTSSVYAALVSAIAAGEIAGETPTRLQTWRDRAAELREAAFTYFWDEGAGRFTSSFSGENWAVFPAGMLELDDPRLESQIAFFADYADDVMQGQADSLCYNAKAFLTLAWYYRQIDDAAGLARMRQIMTDFIEWVPTKDTRHMGETALMFDLDGDGFRETAENQVAVPHVWEQALNFTAALLAFGGAPLPPVADDDDDDNNNNDNNDNDDNDNDAADDDDLADDDDTAGGDDDDNDNDDDEVCGC